MRGGFPAVCCLDRRMGLGRLGVCPCGRPGGRLSCTGVRGGWFVWCWHERHARCCPVGWWWVPPRALVCGGGMLSGFWGSAPWLPDLSGAPDLLGVVGGCGWVGCELYSGREHLTVRFLRQNCFLFCSCVFVVCFFERSVDALASGADEGRGGLRYSSGSRLAGCDPRVSEWGDPARVMSCHLHLNCIGCGG